MEGGNFLHDLLALHPHAAEKAGSGIGSFSVLTDPVWRNGRCFHILRVDGTSTDFSYRTCLDGENARADVLAALRHAIAGQIITFKREQFDASEWIQCPFTGTLVAFNTCHVDHELPHTFASLASGWLRTEGITEEDVKLKPSTDNQWAREMGDSSQREAWTNYHEQHSVLRIVSRKANMDLQKVQMRTP
jgi:hypothetical protein